MREDESIHLELLEEMDLKLERYRMSQDRLLQKPSPADFEPLHTWLNSPEGGANFLVAPEHTIWESGHSDHMSLWDIDQRDKFSEVIYGTILRLYHKLWNKQDEECQSKLLWDDDDEKIDQLSNALSSVVSSLVPTLAILVLYFVKSFLIRIILVVIFTGVFSGLLSIFTKARRIEIFSATAAFAAVVVVFVSNGVPETGSNS
ncbi:hypothetical protein KCU65_g6898, partial [Aureobasidium melanogenum]